VTSVEEQLKGGLVGSCQAAPADPLENTDAIRRIARAVTRAGVSGLRINSPEDIAAIRQDTDLPIIGIQKRYVNGKLRITPDFASAAALAQAGASIVALDCTNRQWNFGEPWRELIARIHSELKLPVMADVATLEEAVAASEAGADFVGTTLNGYTEQTRGHDRFDWDLLAELARRVKTPIIAEGHIATPAQARRAIACGAWCVVVGSAITRPGVIAAGFVKAVRLATGPAAIGVDIGGTAIKAGVVASNGTVLATAVTPTDAKRGREAIKAGLVAAIEEALDNAKTGGVEVSGIGIASAGAIDARDGSVFAATDNLPGWAGFGLRAFVEQKFALPTRAVNDAQAAALAELYFGAGRSLDSFAAITVGTGVGGGFVVGGRLVQGGCGFAGTFGHQVIRVDGKPCNCGRRGCLEAYVSTAALLDEYLERAGKGASAGLAGAALARKVSELAQAGDAAAVAAYSALAGYLAEGIANIFNVLDPQAVFLSGGLVEGHSAWADDVRSRVQALLHFGQKRAPRVELSTLGYTAGVQGAAALLREE
jgi:putative N-acetylmannosamine-6-phosphate epimerase/predicted NBD/HSP70 family sugar kinase